MTQQHFEALVSEVATSVGFKAPTVYGDSYANFPMAAIPGGIIANPYVIIDWSDKALKGGIAHELAHIALGHVVNPVDSLDAQIAHERDADAWATHAGYGRHLVAAFKLAQTDIEDKTHDPIAVRIKAVSLLARAYKGVKRA